MTLDIGKGLSSFQKLSSADQKDLTRRALTDSRRLEKVARATAEQADRARELWKELRNQLVNELDSCNKLIAQQNAEITALKAELAIFKNTV